VGLRRNGLWAEIDYGSAGLKSQMKKADRLGARHVLIVGDDELKTSRGTLRNMLTKEQVDVELKDAVNILKEILKNEREPVISG
jgi:histidyl-tRNA synthetase